MADWRSRMVLGATVVVLAPLSARLGISTGGEAAGARGTSHPSSWLGGPQAGSDASTAVADLTNPRVARRVSGDETRQEFRRTLCGFLVLYGGSQPVPEPARGEPARKAAVTGNDRGEAGKQTSPPEVCTDPTDGSVEAMIAVVPDPVRTHLALRFDRAMDDLENSAQQLGWRFHKAWLPWSSSAETAEGRFQDRLVDAQMEERREDQPGLLLFRAQDSTRPLVVLVVGDTPTGGVNAEQFRNAVDVWRSLHTRLPTPCQSSENEDCKRLSQRLTILGPTFSGSVASLRSLVNAEFASRQNGQPCSGSRLEVAVASGTITSAAGLAELLDPEGECAPSVQTTAVSFSADINYVRAHLLRFLNDRLPRQESGIAELTEEESQFGAQAGENQSLVEAKELVSEQKLLALALERIAAITTALKTLDAAGETSPPNADQKQRIERLQIQKKTFEESATQLRGNIHRQQNLVYFLEGLFTKTYKPLPNRGDLFANRREFLDGRAPRPMDRPYFQFTFPRGISLLRKAYAENGILGFGKSASDAPRTQLQLNFREESTSGDAIPSFSGTQGAGSMESRMAQIASTLEKDKVAVAVLSATDVLDAIFVARYLRAHAPSVTLVIQDADLLFLRGGSDGSLDGVYVVTPYPLIPRNGVWSTDGDSALGALPQIAESQGDEGTVNAARYLLCAGEWNRSVSFAPQDLCGWKRRDHFQSEYLWMADYEPPFPVNADWENDYKLQPPLWLSVIGHGGFQPVSLIDVDQRDAQPPTSSARTKTAGISAKVNPAAPSDPTSEQTAQAGQPDSSLESPESSSLSLPRLGDVNRRSGGQEDQVEGTRPREISDEPLLEMYVAMAMLWLVLAIHAWACTRCRLDRSFAWSYAAADEKPWLTRLMVQVGLNLLGMYVLSLLLLHDMPGLHLEDRWFRCLLVLAQIGLVALTGAVAWRSGAGGKDTRRHLELLVITVLGSAAFVVVADCWLWQWLGPNANTPAERTFFYYRSAYLLDGACPMLPVLLLAGALAVWLRGRLVKLVFYGYRIPKLPSLGVDFRCPCDDSLEELNRLLGEPLWGRSGRGKRPALNGLKLKIVLLSVSLVAGVLSLTQQMGPHSLAFSHFDEFVDVAAFMVAVGVVHNLLVSVVAWRLLKSELLMPLRQSHLRWGFNWIRGFSWKRLWTSPESFTAEAELEYAMRNVEADRRGLTALCGPTPASEAYNKLMDAYRSHDKALANCSFFKRAVVSARWADSLAFCCRALYVSLAKESDYRLVRLREQWSTDYGPVTGPESERGLHMGRKPSENVSAADQTYAMQRMADEEFVALVYVTYIRSVLVQIRHRIGTSAVLYILLLWALTGYPWMNRHGILLQMSALLGVLAAVAITIYAQLQHDEILSRTTETESGKLDGEFVSKILSVVGVPLLTLVASQFPEFSNAIFSWLVPGLSSVK